MRIWLVTIGEPVPVGAGRHDRLLRTGYLATVLATRGHEVTWWTSTFNHFKKEHLYAASTTVTLSPNLRVRLLKARGYRHNTSVFRLLDHLTLARSLEREIGTEPVPDVILASLPTVEMALVCVKYGRTRGVPVVVDMRDMWPDLFVAHAPPSLRPAVRLALAPLFRQARLACAEATALTGITDEFLAWGLRHGRRSRSPLDRVFPFGYITEQPEAEALRAAGTFWDAHGVGIDGRLAACFIGTMSASLDLEDIVRAAAILDRERCNVRFILCGVGDRFVAHKRMAAGLSNVLFTGWVDYPRIYSLMRRAHVGLDPLPLRFDFLATINNKAIEYLSAGLPVVSSPDSGVLASLLSEHRCGLSYPHGDSEALAGILRDLAGQRDRLNRMGEDARRLFDASFRGDRVYADFAGYLEDIVRRSAA